MRIARAALLSAAAALAGCASVTTADGRRVTVASSEFRDYVEAVFREQNRVADELAFALEDAAAPDPALAGAEQTLQDACAAVNELATARRDGRPLGARRSLAAAKTVPQCEEAALAAELALGRRD